MEANLLKAGSENREQKEIINKTFCRFFYALPYYFTPPDCNLCPDFYGEMKVSVNSDV